MQKIKNLLKKKVVAVAVSAALGAATGGCIAAIGGASKQVIVKTAVTTAISSVQACTSHRGKSTIMVGYDSRHQKKNMRIQKKKGKMMLGREEIMNKCVLNHGEEWSGDGYNLSLVKMMKITTIIIMIIANKTVFLSVFFGCSTSFC